MMPLFHTPANIMQSHLVGAGVVSDPMTADTWPMFLDHLPDGYGLDDACAVCDTTPIHEGRIQRTGEVCQHFGIQLSVRANDYETAWAKDQQIRLLVDAIHNADVTLDSSEVYRIVNAMKSSAVFLGVDPLRRNRFVSNYVLAIRQPN
jgi:hypothetical protein